LGTSIGTFEKDLHEHNKKIQAWMVENSGLIFAEYKKQLRRYKLDKTN